MGKCVQIFERYLLSLTPGYMKNLHVKKNKKSQITIQETQKPGLDKINESQQCCSTSGWEGSSGGTCRVIWWYVKGCLVVQKGSSGGT
jgi:hypothetical protein